LRLWPVVLLSAAGLLLLIYSFTRAVDSRLLLVLAAAGLGVAAAGYGARSGSGRVCVAVYSSRGVEASSAVSEAIRLAERMATCSRGARILYEYGGAGPASLCVEGPGADRVIAELSSVIGEALVVMPGENGAEEPVAEEDAEEEQTICGLWVPGPSTAARVTRILTSRLGSCIVLDWKGILDPEAIGCREGLAEPCGYIDLSFTVSIPKRVKALLEAVREADGRAIILVDPVELDAEQLKTLPGRVMVVTTDYRQASRLPSCGWPRGEVAESKRIKTP